MRPYQPGTKTAMKMTDWGKAYDAWLADCLKEYNERFNADRTAESIEFGENGAAYPHGIGGTNCIRNAVTPWIDSIHYMP